MRCARDCDWNGHIHRSIWRSRRCTACRIACTVVLVSGFRQRHGSGRDGAVGSKFRVMRALRLTRRRTLAPIFSGPVRKAFSGFALEQRTDPARGDLQHRKAGAARAQPGGRPDRSRASRASAVRSRARLRNNEKVLLAAYRSIARAVDEGRSITPAAEWVLDNFHVVEEQIREIREDLPAGFLSPAAQARRRVRSRDFPRVFGIAWAFVAHTDSRFEPESLRRFVQRLPERRAADHRRAVGGGDHAAHRAGGEPAARRAAHRHQPRRARRRPTRSPTGCSASTASPPIRNALQRVEAPPAHADAGIRRAAGAAAARPGSAVHAGAAVARGASCAARALDTERVVQEEHQRQGASNVTVRNIITSMRLMSDVDWAEFFESVSLVDEALQCLERLRGHGFRDAQSVSQRHRGTRRAARRCRSSRSRSARARHWPPSAPRRRASAIPATT